MTIKTAIRFRFNRSYRGQRIYRSINRARVELSRIIPDRVYARMKHLENTGQRLNLTAPQSFNEKIWWLKLNNRDPLLTICSDKVAVRDYVADRGLENILVPSRGVYRSPEEVPLETFTSRTYLKTNNGCGVNTVYDPAAPFDQTTYLRRFRQGLRDNYYWQSREWNYRNITPSILAEEEISSDDLVDFRFFCFDGQVRLIFVDVDTALPDGQHFLGARRNVYTADFKPINVTVSRARFPLDRVSEPHDLEEMIRIAEQLSEPFVFCRVDLYNPEPGLIRFGEMTFSPGGGHQIADPYEFEEEWGSWIDLGSPKIVRK